MRKKNSTRLLSEESSIDSTNKLSAKVECRKKSIGLTGGIGSGKSTVINLFRLQGAGIIDADLIARELVEQDQPAYERIVEHFTSAILDDRKNIDRRKLRQIIFESPSEKIWLESLLHPLIRQEIIKQANLLDTPYVIIDIPLLKRREDFPYLNRILVIDCSEKTQIQRVAQRDGISEAEAAKIINAQISRQQRNALADDMIFNDENNLTKLKIAVKKLHEKYIHL